MAAGSSTPSSGGFFRTLWRVIRQVFHESAGAIFLIMALFWLAAAVRQWMNEAEPWTWVGLGAFGLMMGSFGVSSFLAARRVR